MKWKFNLEANLLFEPYGRPPLLLSEAHFSMILTYVPSIPMLIKVLLLNFGLEFVSHLWNFEVSTPFILMVWKISQKLPLLVTLSFQHLANLSTCT